MSDRRERRFGDLTVVIDRLICVGFGDCIEEASDAFALDGEGLATFLDDSPSTEGEGIIRACEQCPVDALTVTDAEGRQLVP